MPLVALARQLSQVYAIRRRCREGGGGLDAAVPSHRPRIHEQKIIENLELTNSIRETSGSFDSCNSCKQVGTSRLHELHESKPLFVSRIEFIRSKLSDFSAHVFGVTAPVRGIRQTGTVLGHTDGRRRNGDAQVY